MPIYYGIGSERYTWNIQVFNESISRSWWLHIWVNGAGRRPKFRVCLQKLREDCCHLLRGNLDGGTYLSQQILKACCTAYWRSPINIEIHTCKIWNHPCVCKLIDLATKEEVVLENSVEWELWRKPTSKPRGRERICN